MKHLSDEFILVLFSLAAAFLLVFGCAGRAHADTSGDMPSMVADDAEDRLELKDLKAGKPMKPDAEDRAEFPLLFKAEKPAFGSYAPTHKSGVGLHVPKGHAK